MKTRIRDLRIENKLSQKNLANLIGTTQAVISKIESGFSTPDAGLLINLSEIFHVSTDYILYRSEHRQTTDILLSDESYYYRKYESFFNVFQKMQPAQRTCIYNLLMSINIST